MTRKVFALLIVVALALALSAFARKSPSKPETVLPTLTEFSGSQVVVTWWLVPENFMGKDGVVYLEGINGYKQAVALKPVDYYSQVGVYVGYPVPVPKTGTYWLSYGYFQVGDEVYPIGLLPSEPITITLYRNYLPVVGK